MRFWQTSTNPGGITSSMNGIRSAIGSRAFRILRLLPVKEMHNDCKNCIHLNVCAYVMPDIPTCDSFISKDILDKFIAIGNVNAISTKEIKALDRHFNELAEEGKR